MMENYAQPQPATVVHGLPPAGDLTSLDVNQAYPDTCAIRCQEIILRDFGIAVSEDQLVQESVMHGWYSGSGTAPEDVGNLLEMHGVGVSRFENANIYNLVAALGSGQRVIVGVDSGELWEGGALEQMEDSILGGRPDHALIVAGVDTADPNDVKVILTDPGTGHVAKEYPLAQFMDAWQDSNCMMVATNAPAPVSAPGMINFDYAEGHIGTIGEISFDTWFDLHQASMADAYYVSPEDMANYERYENYLQQETDIPQLDQPITEDVQSLVDIGTPDFMALDMTGDGVPDLVAFDSTGDGTVDAVMLDTTGDGVLDTLVTG